MFNIPPCPQCATEQVLAAGGGRYSSRTSNIFPFTVNHVDGKPMVINDLQHLRQVEQRHGVVFSAFSKDNINDLDPIKNPPTYRERE
jgi:hypothetical protein